MFTQPNSGERGDGWEGMSSRDIGIEFTKISERLKDKSITALERSQLMRKLRTMPDVLR